jgi:transcriptional regulator with XRE-family HTH domain
MVDDTMAARIRALRKGLGLSLQAFGDLAGVSAMAVQKWERGGEIKPVHLSHLVRKIDDANVTEEYLRFGRTAAAGAGPDGLSPLAIDIARRWSALSSERQDWFRDMIFTMHFVEKRFPAMRKGRPRGETYDRLEAAFERDMRQLKLSLE